MFPPCTQTWHPQTSSPSHETLIPEQGGTGHPPSSPVCEDSSTSPPHPFHSYNNKYESPNNWHFNSSIITICEIHCALKFHSSCFVWDINWRTRWNTMFSLKQIRSRCQRLVSSMQIVLGGSVLELDLTRQEFLFFLFKYEGVWQFEMKDICQMSFSLSSAS